MSTLGPANFTALMKTGGPVSHVCTYSGQVGDARGGSKVSSSMVWSAPHVRPMHGLKVQGVASEIFRTHAHLLSSTADAAPGLLIDSLVEPVIIHSIEINTGALARDSDCAVEDSSRCCNGREEHPNATKPEFPSVLAVIVPDRKPTC